MIYFKVLCLEAVLLFGLLWPLAFFLFCPKFWHTAKNYLKSWDLSIYI